MSVFECREDPVFASLSQSVLASSIQKPAPPPENGTLSMFFFSLRRQTFPCRILTSSFDFAGGADLESLTTRIDLELSINSKWIAAIERRRTQSVTHYRYQTTFPTSRIVEVGEEIVKLSPDVLLTGFSPKGRELRKDMSQEVFNERFDFRVRNFEDAVRMNADLARLSQKLLLLDQAKAMKPLQAVLENIVMIGDFLVEMKDLVADQESSLPLLEAKAKLISNSLVELDRLRYDASPMPGLTKWEVPAEYTDLCVSNTEQITLFPRHPTPICAFLSHYFSNGEWEWVLDLHPADFEEPCPHGEKQFFRVGVHSAPLQATFDRDVLPNFYGVFIEPKTHQKNSLHRKSSSQLVLTIANGYQTHGFEIDSTVQTVTVRLLMSNASAPYMVLKFDPASRIKDIKVDLDADRVYSPFIVTCCSVVNCSQPPRPIKAGLTILRRLKVLN